MWFGKILKQACSICASQKAMAELFDCSTDNIGLHLKNIFSTGEQVKEAVTEKISATQIEADREVSRQTMAA